uniref:Lipoprotein p33 n=1 Tax=Malacoplasma penetrans TaxID=28227 RepID=P33_MALPE|nr:RecName: Full=Lipoprotein p33; Flags: Precursor [Malacoplasma penetrans]
MKIKKIKLLKALALTGAFGIVATVPVIVYSCSSTDNNGGTGDNNTGGGGSGTDQQQGTTYTPAIKSDVTLSGALSKIYDTTNTGDSRKNTNTLIAEDIKANPENYFTNGEDLKKVEGWSVTVDGSFDSNSVWTGDAYSKWSAVADTHKGVYKSTSKQLNINSLKDLKSQLDTSAKIKAICDESNLVFSTADADSYKIQNELGFTGGDLLHINVTATQAGKTLNMDLGIPVSDLNLKITDLKVSVTASNNSTGNNVAAVSDLTTNFTYNIGIKEEVTAPTEKPNLAKTDKGEVMKVLKALGYTQTGDETKLDNDKVSNSLGLYNCEFTAVSATPVEGSEDKFTIKLKAKPLTDYVWEDGTNTEKEISFEATFTMTGN